MKKRFCFASDFLTFLLCGIFTLSFMLSGCSSLQEINIEEIVYSPEILEYEKQLCMLDGMALLGKTEGSYSKKVSRLVLDIEDSLKNPSLNKASVARLYALEGRAFLLNGDKGAKAKALYEESVSSYKGDPQSIILGYRAGLILNLEENMKVSSDSKLLVLEQGLSNYKSGDYGAAVAKIDEAFISLGPSFRECYGAVRDKAWSLRNADSASETVRLDCISTGQMLVIAQENSNLLGRFTEGKILSQQALYKKIRQAGLLTAAGDSSMVLLESETVTRAKCARFLWNLSRSFKQREETKRQYSIMYKGNGISSPVADLAVTDPDFDAILGCVENEYLNLEDGINFKGRELVSGVEFNDALKKIK